MDVLTTVEDNLLAKIKALFGNKLKVVDSLPGDLDENLIKQMLIQAPGVYLAFTGGPRRRTEYESSIDGRWVVFAITGHASGEKARRRGDKVMIGAYQIISLIAASLDGYVVDEVGTMDLVKVDPIFNGTLNGMGCTIYGAIFSLPMTFTPELDPAALDDFLTFDASYDFAPKDGIIDAEDKVTLEAP